MMYTVRPPAAAGTFYPADPETLRARVTSFMASAQPSPRAPKALIVPHAGYPYSGPVAASGYRRLEEERTTINRVVLLGPAHHTPVNGLAATSAHAFETPLGSVPVDTRSVEKLLHLPQVKVRDEAHDREHSLEVHLPFLQEALNDFDIVPLLVGQATCREVSEVLDVLWGGPETLIVISSDLSHYHDYHTAQRLDHATARIIEEMQFETLSDDRACGANPIRGLLAVARRHNLHVKAVDLRNSGDTAGPRDRVVGYGAFIVE